MEGLFFSAVRGKRYLSSSEFLRCPLAQWACRSWLLVSEHLRRLVFLWLRNLKAGKVFGKRFPVFELLDKRSSCVWAVLQNVSHQLLQKDGGGRFCMLWRASGFASYEEWLQHASQEVRDLRTFFVRLDLPSPQSLFPGYAVGACAARRPAGGAGNCSSSSRSLTRRGAVQCSGGNGPQFEKTRHIGS